VEGGCKSNQVYFQHRIVVKDENWTWFRVEVRINDILTVTLTLILYP